MDSHQRRDQPQYPDHQSSSGFKNSLFQEQQQQPHSSELSLLPSELNSSFNKATSFSRFPTSNAGTSCFSLAQWEELELQALIYKHMLARVSVPLELVLHIKRSLLGSSPHYLCPELYQHLHPSMLQGTYYGGRSGVDPEPGRCRRTDGKKWRCSREAVVGQKYCERHVHRGRIRSRKHVEIATSSSINVCKAATISSQEGLNQENHFNRPGSLSKLDIFAHNQRQTDAEQVEKGLQSNCSNLYNQEDFEDNKDGGYVLQRFFDEWPKSQLQEPNSRVDYNYSYTSNATSATLLSISIPGDHPISDFSLKLSTCNPEKTREEIGNGNNDNGQAVQPRNNWRGWIEHGEASMGGPLAEALRSSAPSHSPTSVLQKPNGLMSEISSISP